MNRIGFDGYDDGMDGGFRDPARMNYGGSHDREMMYGGASGKKLDKHMAEEWAFRMKNANGTTGPHWTMEQVKQIMAQRNLKYEPLEFWIALNATYSDLCEFFKKHNLTSIDAYIEFAKAFWMEDKDAPDKLAKYYEWIVRQ